MEKCSALLARAAQCRRLATGVMDAAAIEALELLANQFEAQAAEEATAALASGDQDPGTSYSISRVSGGWLVSRGPDRIAVRTTIEGARDEAVRLKTFDDGE